MRNKQKKYMAAYSCHEPKKLGTSCCIDVFAVLRGKHVQEYLFWYQDVRVSAEQISKHSSLYAQFSMFTFHIYGFKMVYIEFTFFHSRSDWMTGKWPAWLN